MDGFHPYRSAHTYFDTKNDAMGFLRMRPLITEKVTSSLSDVLGDMPQDASDKVALYAT